MPKTKRERLTARIMAAMDRAIASPLDKDDGLSINVATNILGEAIGTYECGSTKWTGEILREIVLAYALHSPMDHVEWMAEQADQQFKWVEWWDKKGWIESMTREGDPRRYWERPKKTAARAVAP